MGLAEEAVILGEIECEKIQNYAAEWNFDFIGWVQKGISGDYNPVEWLGMLFLDMESFFLGDLKLLGSSLLAPGMIMVIPRMIVPGKIGAKHSVNFACRVCCISTLVGCFVQMRMLSQELLQSILECSEVMVPVMITATTLSGADTGAMLLTPMSGLLANIIQNTICKWGIAIASVSAVVAVSGNLGERVRLNKLFDLMKRFLHWGVGILIGTFTTMLVLQGKLVAGRDTAATRTARYAIENLLPVVGGELSESLDSLLSAAVNVRNSLGVSGLMLLVSICAVPLTRLLGEVLILKLCSAVLEPAGDEMLTTMISQFGDAVEMLVIIVLAAALLCGLLLGSGISAVQTIVR